MTHAPLAPNASTSSTDSPLPPGERFLRFQLVPGTTALLPLTQLAEVLTIPVGQITPIPQLPAWMMGVYNWRSEALWMVDLAHLVGLTPWYQQTFSITYAAVVLRTGATDTLIKHAADQAIGLVINQTEAIEWCKPDSFQVLPNNVNPQLASFLRGYHRKSNDEQLAVFDDASIIAAILQQG